MAPFYHKPENALKRAEELVAVGQPMPALSLLHDVILSKKFRTTPVAALEPIMLRFLDLCVELQKGKLAKEGLHQYKNVTQNVAVSTIELAIKRFIIKSEAKVTEAQSKAQKITQMDAIEDLEASETPESILMSSVSADGNKDRTDRQVVTPWLKFLWEAYRTALDILRNNARLEILYQSVVNQAFQFCLKYARKAEFRRLVEMLRQHLMTAAKYSGQAYSINLNEPDTLQRHLDTRFGQLNVAAELELWQEAFRSVEDIYNLLSMAKKAPKPFMMANYYEKLARIFLKGDNHLFHAAAYSKYYAILRSNKPMTDEEHEKHASMVLIASLSIPIISSSSASASSSASNYLDMDENKHKANRLSTLLRVARPPSRESLIKDALNKNIFSRVRPELKELYNSLEVQFHPLSISKKIQPIMAAIQKVADLAKYVKPLQSVILTRLLQQLSQVYTTVTLDSVVKLASFGTPEMIKYDADTIEKFVMNGCRRGELSIRISHQTRTLTFDAHVFGGSGSSSSSISQGPRLQALPSEQMRLQLSRLAKRLQSACVMIQYPIVSESLKQQRIQSAEMARVNALTENEATVNRRLLIEKKKELKEYESSRIEREEHAIRLKREQEIAEAERIRIETETRRREEDRMKAHRAEIEKQETKKLAEKIAEDLKQRNLKVNMEDLENLDADKLVQIQLKQLEQERQELASKLKQVSKRHDFLERAMRKEEIPLLKKDFEDQRKLDRAYYVALKKAQLEASKIKHVADMKFKERLLKIKPEYDLFRAQLTTKRDAEYAVKVKEAAIKLEEAKEKRRKEHAAKKEADRVRREREAEEEKKRIEMEKIEAEKRKQEEAERAERDRIKRQEDEERLRKLDEQTKRQAERERLAEEKIRSSRAAAAGGDDRNGSGDGPWRLSRPSGGRSETDTGGGNWRRGDALPPSSSSSSSSGGRYVLPSARRSDNFGDRDGSDRRSGGGLPFGDRDNGERRSGGGGGFPSSRYGSGDQGSDDRSDRDSSSSGNPPPNDGKYRPPAASGSAYRPPGARGGGGGGSGGGSGGGNDRWRRD